MLIAFLSILSFSLSQASPRYFSIESKIYPRSTMEFLDLIFSLNMISGEEYPVKVNLTISIDGQHWKTIEKEVTERDEFSGISLPAGTAFLKLSAKDFDSWNSDSFKVEQSRLKLELSPLYKESFVYVPNDYCFTMKDHLNNPWNLLIQSTSCLTENNTKLPNEEEFCFKNTFYTAGLMTLKVYCDQVPFSFDVYVTDLKIRMDSFDAPTFSSDFLNISYSLINNESFILTRSDLNFYIELNLQERKIAGDGPCSGLVMKGQTNKTFNAGKASFSMINVLSNGRFVVVASCEGLRHVSPIFLVTNFIKKVYLDTSTQPMHFSYLSVFLRAIGDDNRDFVRQVDFKVDFNKFHCTVFQCAFVACYKCLPMWLNENVKTYVADKAYNQYSYSQDYNFSVLPNPNAQVKIRILEELNDRFPFPAMHYDQFSLKIYITNGKQNFYDIPCFSHGNYIEKVCVSERCSNNVKVEKINTICVNNCWEYTYSYVGDQSILSLGDYVYNVPFINELNGTSAVINMTSFIKDIILTPLTRINHFNKVRFLLKLFGQDGFLYVKQNDVEIFSNDLQSPVKIRISEGMAEFTAVCISFNSCVLHMNSTHYNGSKMFEFKVEEELISQISNLSINNTLYTSENFAVSYSLVNISNFPHDCLLTSINPTFEFINVETNERIIISGNQSCLNTVYLVSNLKLIHPGEYSLEINSSVTQLYHHSSTIIIKEKVFDARLEFPSKLYKNQPFNIKVFLYSSSLVHFNLPTVLTLTSDSIYGQLSSKYSASKGKFYIASASEGNITMKLENEEKSFSKDFYVLILPNNGSEILIQSISPNSWESSDIFQVQATVPTSNTNFELSIYGINDKSGEKIEGNLLQNSNQTNLTFTNLKILSSGTFLILLNSSDGLVGISKEEVTIKNKILNLTIESSSEVTSYTHVSIAVHIIGEDENYFLEESNVLLTLSNFIGPSSIVTTTGIAIFEGYFTLNGSYIIEVTIQNTNISDSSQIVVINPNFTILFENIHPIPTLSKDFFNVSVKVIDSLTKKMMMGMEQNISLSIIPVNNFISSGTKLAGIVTQETVNATAKFINLKILSSGRFRIQAAAENSMNGFSQILAITNFIASINQSPPEKPYFIYDKLTFMIYAYGDDDKAYQRKISFNDSYINIHRYTEFKWDCNCILYTLYLICMGDSSFSVNVNDFEVFSTNASMISGPNPYARVVAIYGQGDKDYPYPALSSDVIGGCGGDFIKLQINVRENQWFPLNLKHCTAFSARIACVSDFCSGESVILGEQNIDFYNNICTNIIIKSTGNFKVFFSIEGANEGEMTEESQTKIVNITNFVKEINFHTIESRAEVNKNYSVMFSVYGDDDLLYIKRNNLSINSSCLNQSKIVNCEFGIAQTNLTFKNTGICEITVKSTHSQIVERIFKINVESDLKNSVKYINISSKVNFTSKDIFNITFKKDSQVISFSSAPNIYLLSKNNLESSISCNNITEYELEYKYDSCKILTTGSYYLTVQNLTFYNKVLNVKGEIKNISTYLNKTIFAVGELFEIKALVLAEDNSVFRQEIDLELVNTELIGLKSINCTYQRCSFLVACNKISDFQLKYITKTYPNKTFDSDQISCIEPQDDFISFEPIASLPINTSSIFNSTVYVNSSKLSKYNNTLIQLKILKINSNILKPMKALNSSELKDRKIEFFDLKIPEPGKYVLIASFVTLLHLNSFVYGNEFQISSPIYKIKIITPKLVSNSINTTIEVQVYMINDQLCDDSTEIQLNVSDKNLSRYTVHGVAKFFIKLLINQNYSFSAFQPATKISDSLNNIIFGEEKYMSLRILDVTYKDKQIYPSLSWDSSYFVVGLFDISGSFLMGTTQAIITLILNNIKKNSDPIIKQQISIKSSNGIANFTNITINSIGYFSITFSCTRSRENVTSPIFQVTNFLKGLECNHCPNNNQNYPIYNISTLVYNILAEDQNIYNRPISFNVYNHKNVKVESTGAQGKFSWYGYQLGEGSFSISFLDYIFHYNFNLTNNYDLKIEVSEEPFPARSSDIFKITATIPGEFTFIKFDITIELFTENQHTIFYERSATHISKDLHRYDRFSPRSCEFTNIRIYNNGNCYFKVSMPGLNSVMSKTYNITNFVKKIKLEIDNSVERPRFYPIYANFSLIAEDDYPYSFPWSMTMLADGLVGKNTIDNYGLKGLFQVVLYFETSGTKLIKVVSENGLVTTSATVTISNEIVSTYCELSFFNEVPTTSRDMISLNLTLYDEYNFEKFPFLREGYASLELHTVGNNSGLIMTETEIKKVINGSIKFENIRILSSGIFYFKSYPEIGSPCETQTFKIKNFIGKIDISSSHNAQSANFDLSIAIVLTGDDGNLFEGEDILTIYETRSSEIKGNTIIHASGSYINSTIFFPLSGTKLVRVNSTFSKVQSPILRISSLKNLLVLTMINNTETNINPFAFSVNVYSNDGLVLENKNSNYNLVISTSPANKLLGELKITAKNGTGIFKNLCAKSPGQFNVYVSKSGFIQSSKINLNILHFLEEIDIQVPKDLKSTIFFTVVVNLYKNGGLPFKEYCELTLSSDGIMGNTTKYNNNGTNSFEIYFLVEGIKELTAKCGIIEKKIEIEVLQFLTNDTLCRNPYNFTHCQVCFNKAVPVKGTCTCIDFSESDLLLRGCSCIEKSFEYQNVCYGEPRRFFMQEQLTSYFSESYKSIFIEFETRADVNIGSSCFPHIIVPDFMQPFITYCLWKTDSLIEIILNQVILFNNITIQINGFLVYSLTNLPSYRLQELKVDVVKKYEYPVPLANIIAPSNISFQCSSENIQISSKEQNLKNEFSWSAFSNPQRPDLEDFIKKIKEPKFAIPTKLLLPTVITLNLNVTDNIFKTMSQALHILTIQATKILIVTFSNIGPLRYSPSDDFLIQSVVRESCGASQNYNYTWNYLTRGNTKKFNFTKLLLNRQRAGTLRILPNSLPSGQYTFSVRASSESISGSNFIDIEIQPSPLVLRFSRSNGTIPGKIDVFVDTEAFDPDDLSENVTVIWTCSLNGNICFGSNDEKFEPSVDRNKMKIPKGLLRHNVSYIFTAVAKTSLKTITKSLEFISNNTSTDIAFKSIEGKVNIDKELKIIPQIQAANSSEFSWTIEDPVSLPSNGFPFLTIPANTLSPGKMYKVTLKLSLEETSSSIWLKTNMNPTCSDLSASYNKNWKITANNCQDFDEDFPLIYMFGIKMNSQSFWMTNALYSNSLSVGLPSSATQVFCKICDDLGSCSFYDSAMLTGRRELQTFRISDFLAEVRNFELIPVNILIYSDEVFSRYELQVIYNVFYDYFSGEIISENSVDIMVECFKAIFKRDELASNEMIINGTDFLVDMLTGIKFDISLKNGKNLIETIELYRKRLAVSKIIEFVTKVASFMSNEDLPSSYSEVAGSLFMVKEIGSALPGFSKQIGKLKIQVPKTSIFDPSTIYDIQIISSISSSLSIVDVKLLTSGTYKRYSLKQTHKNDSLSHLDQKINLIFQGEFNENQIYECETFDAESSSSTSCSVSNSTSTSLTLEVSSEATFVVVESSTKSSSDEDCEIGYFNIGILAGLFVISFGLLVVSFFIQKDDSLSPKLLFLPSSLFFTSNNSIKVLAFFEMLSIFILIQLAMNICIDLNMKDPQNIEFNRKSVVLVVISLAICQAYSAFIYFILRRNEFTNKRPIVFVMIFGFIVFICVSLIIIFSINNCLGSTLAYLKLYLVILGMECLIEICYSFVLYLIIKPFYNRNSERKQECSEPNENSHNRTEILEISGINFNTEEEASQSKYYSSDAQPEN